MDVLNTPFNTALEKTKEEMSARPAAVHFVVCDPQTREVSLAHGSDFAAVPSGSTLVYRFEGDNLVVPSFRESWNQAKTDILRAVEKRDKRFAHLG